MIKSNSLEDLITGGASNAYFEHCRMTHNNTGFSERVIEYHLTVGIAQMLLKRVEIHNCRIELEYPIKDFYNNAFAENSFTGGRLFEGKMIDREDHNPENNIKQRLDIALTYSGEIFEGERVAYGIEVKSIDQSDDCLLFDIKRLSSAIASTEKYSANSIEAGYSLFLRNHYKGKKILETDFLNSKKTNTRDYWRHQIAQLEVQFPTLKFKLEETSFYEETHESIQDQFDPEEDMYSDVAEATGSVVCYLLKISRKA